MFIRFIYRPTVKKENEKYYTSQSSNGTAYSLYNCVMLFKSNDNSFNFSFTV
ncbi:hypothetical protein HanXRQr2_Chr08g0322531 [Helianthus annuus]|uniref:Uncharacterized protein n=1 Tax=Helianthus annuus TaxID=4232 RepID=A0A9K3NBC9_HELAN|nr:hypothetical protein HanXRQr2_Chr08g0322531 [Helianthus annuus]KAJ0900312.1 hypothetical protein HanPSC8_Chr08g0312431 [Helianthus annuus]